MTGDGNETLGRNGIPHTCTSHMGTGKLQALDQSVQAVAHRSAAVQHRKPRGNHSRRDGQRAWLKRFIRFGDPETNGILLQRAERVREACRVGETQEQWPEEAIDQQRGRGKTWGSVGQTRRVRSTSLGHPNAVFRRHAVGRHSSGMGITGGLSCKSCLPVTRTSTVV